MRKPMVPTVPPRGGGGVLDKGLAVKDGLREVRFNVRHGAKKLVEAVEAATHPDDRFEGPLGPLGKPLHLAVRRAADLLHHVDQAAVHLLAPDADLRSMSVPLWPSATYFTAGAGPARAVHDLRGFSADHHWRYRHWLALNGCDDVFVHEQAIAQAGAEVAEALISRPLPAGVDRAAPGEFQRWTAAVLVQALLRQEVLTQAALLPDESKVEEELPGLRAAGAVVVVLAGEIAASVDAPTAHDRYVGALRLADEIVMADPAGWQPATAGADAPTEVLARWFGFVLRHL